MGCGYVGTAVGKLLLALGHEVHGVRRAEAGASELAGHGIRLLIADASKPADLARLPSNWDWVVNSISASGSGAQGYRSAYLETTRNMIAWLVRTPPKSISTPAALGYTHRMTARS
jgi:nucleoside-diphosphate-sugar epimerase